MLSLASSINLIQMPTGHFVHNVIHYSTLSRLCVKCSCQKGRVAGTLFFFGGGGGGHSEGSLIGALCLCCNNYLLLIQNSCMGASGSATLITQSYQ